ncbi:MAG: hypothetical protein L6408_07955 [Nanoarchaeota archaeon]|nr:hypothetical protein [Nanoarchaeota archaeon]
MKARLLFVPLMFLLIVFSVSAVRLETAECFDDGRIEITLKADGNTAYTNSIKIIAEGKNVKGSWDNDFLALTSYINKRATFTSLENRLVEERTYQITMPYEEKIDEQTTQEGELTFELDCPGLIFTCEKMGIKLNDCVTSKREKITAHLDIYGLEQSPGLNLDPLKVIDFKLRTQMLYRDINEVVSKTGSLPKGATITKVADNKYLLEANFDSYTTNRIYEMSVNFNDNLKRPCSPVDYPNIILSDKTTCVYIETEEDKLEEKKEKEETKAEESARNTGFSVVEDEPIDDKSRKKSQLKTLMWILLGSLLIGGVLLYYLYEEGYFY